MFAFTNRQPEIDALKREIASLQEQVRARDSHIVGLRMRSNSFLDGTYQAAYKEMCKMQEDIRRLQTEAAEREAKIHRLNMQLSKTRYAYDPIPFNLYLSEQFAKTELTVKDLMKDSHSDSFNPNPNRTPVPHSDLICAWANGFRVQFRYMGPSMHGGSDSVLLDPNWYLCGPYYHNFSRNQHRIHPDDVAAWEAFKRKPAEDAARGERARIVAYVDHQSRVSLPNRLAYQTLANKIRNAEDIF